MLLDMLNDIHFLQEKQTLRLATYWLHLYFSSKKQSALLQLSANSISFPCITRALETCSYL